MRERGALAFERKHLSYDRFLAGVISLRPYLFGCKNSCASNRSMEWIMDTKEYKQRLLAEERRLSQSIRRADENARDLSGGPSVEDRGDASVRDEEKDGGVSGSRY